MPNKKLIDVPRYEPGMRRDAIEEADLTPTAVDLPQPAVLDAGVKKFFEMANLYWPSKGGVITFDPKNRPQLRMALGLVYMAMQEVDNAD